MQLGEGFPTVGASTFVMNQDCCLIANSQDLEFIVSFTPTITPSTNSHPFWLGAVGVNFDYSAALGLFHDTYSIASLLGEESDNFNYAQGNCQKQVRVGSFDPFARNRLPPLDQERTDQTPDEQVSNSRKAVDHMRIGISGNQEPTHTQRYCYE
jgi:hypothetical protein